MLTRIARRTVAAAETGARSTRRATGRWALMLAALLAGTGAYAQKQDAADYPTRPIRFIIGFLPGGVSDTIARVVSDRLSKELGQRVVVDGRPGAGGVLAMDLTVNATPDGYTWYLAQPVLGISKLFKNKPKYDPLTALDPVALLGFGPTVLVAHPSFPVKTVKELIAFAKKQKEPVQFGSSGPGSTNHFAGELLKVMAKIPLQHVPYKGAGANALAVIGGEIPLAFQPLAAAVPHLEAGRLKGLAVTGAKRSKAVPQLPTVAETIPGYRVEAWYGIVAPAGTPQPIVQKINAATNKVLGMPEVADALLKRGVEVETASPAEFGKLIRDDAGQWAKLVKEAGISFE